MFYILFPCGALGSSHGAVWKCHASNSLGCNLIWSEHVRSYCSTFVLWRQDWKWANKGGKARRLCPHKTNVHDWFHAEREHKTFLNHRSRFIDSEQDSLKCGLSQLIELPKCSACFCHVVLYKVRKLMEPIPVNGITQAEKHKELQIPLKPEATVSASCFLSCFYSVHFPRVPPDSSAVQHRAGELPFDCCGSAGGGPHTTSWRRDPPRAGLQPVLLLPAAPHHPGCWLLPAHPSFHGEPGHNPHFCCCGDLVECLLYRGPAVRGVSDPASQSVGPPPAGAPTMPPVWLHRLRCGSCGCASCVRGDSHQWIAAHFGVWGITAQRCCHCGETFMLPAIGIVRSLLETLYMKKLLLLHEFFFPLSSALS